MRVALVILIVAGAAFFWQVSNPGAPLSEAWPIEKMLAYRYYSFMSKMGMLSPSDRDRFVSLVEEALDIAKIENSIPGMGQWLGHVYPDKHDLTEAIAVGRFSTLASCRDAALVRLNALGAVERGDYECGKNCQLTDPDLGLWVCDETVR